MRDFKALFFTGLTLIISGILLKISTPETWISSVLISLGGTAKILFLILTLRKNKMRPGYEMLFLLAGLALVILGAQLRKEPATLAFALPELCAKNDQGQSRQQKEHFVTRTHFVFA